MNRRANRNLRWTPNSFDLQDPAELLAGVSDARPRVRHATKRAYQLFENNPAHPSLRFKKLAGYERVWSVRINEQYRAIGERRGDTIVWVWIGSHNDFDNMFG